MKNIIIKNKSLIKGPAQYRRHKPSGSGFVILFAVTLSSILLAIALGVSDIALKEVRFGTNARDTNNAFFAADVGVECALYHDKSTQNKFPVGGPAAPITCANVTTTPNLSGNVYSFILSGLGSSSKGCAEITVNKAPPLPLTTIIISKGYNDGGSAPGACTQGSNSVERELKITY